MAEQGISTCWCGGAERSGHAGVHVVGGRGVSKQRQTPYKPRSGKVGASLRHYTQDQVSDGC